MGNLKKCTKCGEEKPSDQFAKDSYRCKSCVHLYYVENKEKIKKNASDYYYANREERKEKTLIGNRKSYHKHKAKLAVSKKQYRVDNKERIIAYNDNYRKQHMELYRNTVRKRRALRKGATVEYISVAEIDALLLDYNYCCAYCGASDVKLEIDHVYPISKGGAHALSNLVPACIHCNRSKHDKLPIDWLLSLKDK